MAGYGFGLRREVKGWMGIAVREDLLASESLLGEDDGWIC